MNYKNHIIGPNYTIHGNILLGPQVLDSMEARFNRENGDLACKLMAALQGAKMVGADSRCASNNSSSLFAFIKVSQPTDAFGLPSFILSLKTHAGDSIEPIDSLHTLFNAARSCTFLTVGIKDRSSTFIDYKIYPNPASGTIGFKTTHLLPVHCVIYDLMGSPIMELSFTTQTQIDTRTWPKSVYIARFSSDGIVKTRRIVLIE
jgi:uncharacterized Ntn-hydrolase superfamily protein